MPAARSRVQRRRVGADVVLPGRDLPAASTAWTVVFHAAAGNLIENAVRHNVDGGRVHVETRTTADGATLRITNDGPVIPDDGVDDSSSHSEECVSAPTRKTAPDSDSRSSNPSATHMTRTSTQAANPTEDSPSPSSSHRTPLPRCPESVLPARPRAGKLRLVDPSAHVSASMNTRRAPQSVSYDTEKRAGTGYCTPATDVSPPTAPVATYPRKCR